MTRALALRLLRSYPLAWRERYEAEVCALIEESTIGLKDLGELTRGLLTERARELLFSTDQPKRTLRLLSLLKPLSAAMFVVLAAAAGLTLRTLTGPWPAAAREPGSIAFSMFLVVVVTILFCIRRRPWTYTEPPYPAWAGVVLLPCIFLAVTFVVAGRCYPVASIYESHTLGRFGIYARWMNWVFYTSFIMDLASSLWPANKLLQEFGALQAAENQIKSAQQWVNGCHKMIALGVPSPLGEAEAQLGLATRRRDEIQERIEQLGYRARFRQDLKDRVSA